MASENLPTELNTSTTETTVVEEAPRAESLPESMSNDESAANADVDRGLVSKSWTETGVSSVSGIVLLAILAHAWIGLERPVAVLLSVCAVGWFFIVFIVLARPPGVPKLKFNSDFEDPIKVDRVDPFQRLPYSRRLACALTISAIVCFATWGWLLLHREPV